MSMQPGERFGRYELESRLGHGGMAETWRARLVGDEGVTKPVLIKRVLPQYATDQAFTSMFISEARISATLSHGNIAQVYDFGRVDGEYFLAMEFVEGQPLNRILKRARQGGLSSLPFSIAAFIAMEMCRGLHYAHTRKGSNGMPLGIVHRDISPDNVLVSYEGQVKIVDFGIAKARELREVSTEPGVVKGKYLFFSPEQARGEEVDGRTDVWATGVVLYEMLCGRLPAQGPEYVALPKLIKGEFPPPRELQPRLPPELNTIVMRALAVDPATRFESSHAFGDALAGFLYSATPRFSGESLSYLVQELFRAELEHLGHEVNIPATFAAQLAQWRQVASARVSDNDLLTARAMPGVQKDTGETVATPGRRALAPAPAPVPVEELATRPVVRGPRSDVLDTGLDVLAPRALAPRKRTPRAVVVTASLLLVVLGFFFWRWGVYSSWSLDEPPEASVPSDPPVSQTGLPPPKPRPVAAPAPAPEASAALPQEDKPIQEERWPEPLPPSGEVPFWWIMAKWEMGRGGNWVQDLSGRDHHGRMPQEGVRGVFGGLEFLGTTGVVEIPDHQHFALQAPFTLHANLKILSFHNERGIIYRRADARQEALSLETRPGGLVRFSITQAAGQTRFIEGKLPDDSVGQLVGIIATLDEQGEMKLYADCTLLGRGRLTGGPLVHFDRPQRPQVTIGGVKGKPYGLHAEFWSLSLEKGVLEKSPKGKCNFIMRYAKH